MFREFDNGMAVVEDGNGEVLWQLVKIVRTPSGKTRFAQDVALIYGTKKEATRVCKHMGFPVASVTKARNLMGDFYYIKYDPRYDYAIGCWEV